jgi:fermentation-respiration switch protein FrsA (DUF1100 family)
VRLEQLAPVEHVADLAPAPVLFLTGTDDIHAPPEDTERLVAPSRSPHELWLVPGVGHSDMYTAGGQPYCRRIVDFLDSRLFRPARQSQRHCA